MAYSYPPIAAYDIGCYFKSTDLQDPVLFLMTNCHMGQGETAGNRASQTYDKTLLVVQAVPMPYFAPTKFLGGKRNELLQK
ncbi:hypothetical protein DES34_10279 [Brevibacillus brevis]|nr:hypothetical protein C7J99_29265 [Brevibacillus brevis]RED33914.1 hypothetical protein DES34_10279 [Brevibacillus brevis]GEC89422.1 hypothetical protein BBR01nite_17530 [Brevibacillus brevis]VEF92516.1 Uncharacterised protein [Brevibacillus brevis]